MLPFFEALVSFEVTGSTLKSALVNGISAGIGDGRFPQTNVQFVYNPNPAAAPTTPSGTDHSMRLMDIKLKNAATGQWGELELTRVYRVVTNAFVQQGGDGYSMFKDSSGDLRVLGRTQIDAFVAWLNRSSAATPYDYTTPVGSIGHLSLRWPLS